MADRLQRAKCDLAGDGAHLSYHSIPRQTAEALVKYWRKDPTMECPVSRDAFALGGAAVIGGCGHGCLASHWSDIEAGQRHLPPPRPDEVATCVVCKQQVYWHFIDVDPDASTRIQPSDSVPPQADASSPLLPLNGAEENPPHRHSNSGVCPIDGAIDAIDWSNAVDAHVAANPASRIGVPAFRARASTSDPDTTREPRPSSSKQGRAIAHAFDNAYAGVKDPLDVDGIEAGTGVGLAGLARGGGGSGAAFRPFVARAEHEEKCRARLASLQAALFRFERRESGTLNGHAQHYRVYYADALGGRQTATRAVESGSGGCFQDDFSLYPKLPLVATLPLLVKKLEAAGHTLLGEGGLAQVCSAAFV